MKLQLSYPLDMVLASQGFGQNAGMYADLKYGGIKGHNGIDFYVGHGKPVYATHDGTAYFEIDPSGGCGVVIVGDEMFDFGPNGVGFPKTIYWHLCWGKLEPQFKSPMEDKGKVKVQNGDLIGYADNTGASTGDHLHFGLKVVDGGGSTMNKNNGYLGAIDPNPYFDGGTPKQISLMWQKILLLQTLIKKLIANK